MAKYGSANVTIEVDDAGGSPVDLSDYTTQIGPFDIEAMTEESHAFGDAWREYLATGIRTVSEIPLSGFYDDTVTVGPHAILSAVFSSPGTTPRTLKVTWGGGKSSSVECVIKRYSRRAIRGELTKFEAVLLPTGAVTEV